LFFYHKFQVLIGMVEGELKFLTKTSLCQVEKNNADLKNRILQLGQLYYGEEYFNYSLTGKKSGKTVIHKIEPEHLVGIASTYFFFLCICVRNGTLAPVL